MKCLVVVAHPLTESLCMSLTGKVVETLTGLGHVVKVENLHENNFNPLLTKKERKSYYNSSYDSSAVSKQVEDLLEADAIVLLFPTWWFGFPAVLKGWFDRVWGPGIAYDHAADMGPIKPRLHNLKKMFVITTLGAPGWVDYLVMWQPMKRIIKIALLKTCAPNCRLEMLSLYKSEKLDKRRVGRFMNRIEKSLQKWNQEHENSSQ